MFPRTLPVKNKQRPLSQRRELVRAGGKAGNNPGNLLDVWGNLHVWRCIADEGWGEMKIILETIMKWLSLVQALNFPEPLYPAAKRKPYLRLEGVVGM